jgi:hypothetical protein
MLQGREVPEADPPVQIRYTAHPIYFQYLTVFEVWLGRSHLYIDCPYIRSITVCLADNRSAKETFPAANGGIIDLEAEGKGIGMAYRWSISALIGLIQRDSRSPASSDGRPTVQKNDWRTICRASFGISNIDETSVDLFQ